MRNAYNKAYESWNVFIVYISIAVQPEPLHGEVFNEPCGFIFVFRDSCIKEQRMRWAGWQLAQFNMSIIPGINSSLAQKKGAERVLIWWSAFHSKMRQNEQNCLFINQVLGGVLEGKGYFARTIVFSFTTESIFYATAAISEFAMTYWYSMKCGLTRLQTK